MGSLWIVSAKRVLPSGSSCRLNTRFAVDVSYLTVVKILEEALTGRLADIMGLYVLQHKISQPKGLPCFRLSSCIITNWAVPCWRNVSSCFLKRMLKVFVLSGCESQDYAV